MKADDSAPGDQPAGEVGSRRGHEEGVRRRAGTEGPGDDEIAEEAEDPARQRGRAHHGGGARHRATGRGGGRLRRRCFGVVDADREVRAHRPSARRAEVPMEALNLDSLDGAR
jgi:hypothetical protein